MEGNDDGSNAGIQYNSAGKTVRAADPTTTIQVTGIEEGCNVYAYAVAIDAVDANGNHYWKYNPEGNVESRVKDGKGGYR